MWRVKSHKNINVCFSVLLHTCYSSTRTYTYAVVGIIIWDHHGKTLQVVSFNLDSTQVHIAEGASLQQGIIQARQFDITNIHIEGDNLLIITYIKQILPPMTNCFCHPRYSSPPALVYSWIIRHIYKEANKDP